MARPKNRQDLDSGSDSFLDVVSNIVGILIILVVIVGAQVRKGLTLSRMEEIKKQARAEAPLPLPQPTELNSVNLEKQKAELEAELTRTLGIASGVQAELADLEIQSSRLDSETTLANSERVQLGTYLALIQKEMSALTSTSDLQKKERLLLNRKILELDDTLQKARGKLDSLASAAGENGGPKKIEHRETPIIRSVDTQETHFILQDGRILHVPLEELVGEYSKRLQTVAPSLIKTGSRTDVIGPMDGFSLHAQARIESGRLDVFWTLHPPAATISGETLDMALAPVSQFKHHLEKLNPEKDIVTFWIYPSGFSEYLQLRDEVYRMGFSIASRPLPEGTPIAGSPYGQKSVAQ